MSARAFLDRVEAAGVVNPTVVTELREQLAMSPAEVPPEQIARLLVDKGELSQRNADKLLAGAPPEAFKKPEVGLADDDGTQHRYPPSPPPEEELVELEEADEIPPPAPPPPRPAPGPLDDLSSLDQMSGYDPLGQAAAMDYAPLGADQAYQPHSAGPGAHRAKKRRRNPWESPFVYLGLGGLALLVILLVVLVWTNWSTPAEKMFEAAEESYRKEAYTEAIRRYDDFLAAYPSDHRASLAKVRREMARIRQAAEGKRWEKPLEIAQSSLPKIEKETAFSEARPELAGILPDIAEGFAAQANETGDIEKKRELVAHAKEAMELVDNAVYIPTSLRKSQEARIEGIEDQIAEAERAIEREEERVARVAEINELVRQGKTAEAYEVRRSLLRRFRSLGSDKSLQEALLAASRKQQELCRVENQALPPELEEDKPAFRIVLAGGSGGQAQGVESDYAAILAGGAVYCLRVSSGEVVWRRFVGFETDLPPQRLSPAGDAAVLVIDERQRALSRVDAADDRLQWRFPLAEHLQVGESLLAPQPYQGRLLAATSGGKVFELDAESGGSSRQAQLPQPIAAAPFVDEPRGLVYVVADHSNIFLLGAEDLTCGEVYFLGHEEGAVAASPVAVQGRLLVIVNSVGYAEMHVLMGDESGLGLAPAQSPLRIGGNVSRQPLVTGSRIIVTTDRGAIHVFELEPGAEGAPVKELAAVPAASAVSRDTYALMDYARLFVADNGIRKYEIQASSGALHRDWTRHEGDIFVAPLRQFGDVLLSVRNRRGAPGSRIAAAGARDGLSIWESDLGAPVGGRPLVDLTRNVIVAAGGAGSLYEIDGAAIQQGFIARPAVSAEAAMDLRRRLDLDGGRVAFSADPAGSHILLYDPARSAAGGSRVKLSLGEGRATSLPVPFGNGLIVPSSAGKVHFIEPDGGVTLALFQPSVAPGESVQWRRPAVLGDELFIADGRKKLFRLALRDDGGERRLAAVADYDLEFELIGPLAALQERLYGAHRFADHDELAVIPAADPAAGEKEPLQGRIVWGPETVGDVVFLVTDAEGLHCLDETGIRWKFSLAGDRALAGPPLADGNDFIVAGIDGTVWRLAGDSGSELARAETGEPLSAGPVAFRNRLLLSTADGALLITDSPAPASAAEETAP